MGEFIKIILMFCVYLFSRLRFESVSTDPLYYFYYLGHILSVVFYGIWCYQMGLNEGRYGK